MKYLFCVSLTVLGFFASATAFAQRTIDASETRGSTRGSARSESNLETSPAAPATPVEADHPLVEKSAQILELIRALKQTNFESLSSDNLDEISYRLDDLLLLVKNQEPGYRMVDPLQLVTGKIENITFDLNARHAGELYMACEKFYYESGLSRNSFIDEISVSVSHGEIFSVRAEANKYWRSVPELCGTLVDQATLQGLPSPAYSDQEWMGNLGDDVKGNFTVRGDGDVEQMESCKAEVKRVRASMRFSIQTATIYTYFTPFRRVNAPAMGWKTDAEICIDLIRASRSAE
jgi:hypothetical protein